MTGSIVGVVFAFTGMILVGTIAMAVGLFKFSETE
ncbi:hypothetical protein BkAM31D_19020 [Halalkalibacter krulwichiae]|uniref:Uncharacterized protein n=1 Tax=Halalkalibacter krulwichiae TaxID=199441 RepID=A0A1X9ME86_9BACI|nr:hypothetical protein BkAM31D_19020 [Halalkalibacter krulwichiae]